LEITLITVLVRFWRGQLPLAKTFWLGWAVPVVGGNLLVSVAARWLTSNLGLGIFYGVVALVIAYGIAAVIPVWRSATTYANGKVIKYAARTVASVVSAIQVVTVGVIVYTLVSIKLGIDPTHDPERISEKTAIPSKSHPMAGFWKSSPADNFGLAISPAEGKFYSVSFCGPGGCFKPGTYRPNTPLVGDEDYKVVSKDTLLVRGQDGWSTYKRAANRGEENCEPK
jgi:hypothetical protein